MNTKLLFSGWVLASVILLMYSFTQVDLNLTLSQFSIWQVIQKFFQYIGYFTRPLSTNLYLTLIVFLFFLYLLTLYLVKKNQIGRRYIWKTIIITTVILFFSYNAFSYDLFNYIFDAKIVTFYNQNPYERKPLDFYEDPYINFMRSTHRTYPYGPVWLILTVPLVFIGSNIFLLTFYLLKFLMAVSFVGSAYFLEKILTFLKMKNPQEGLVLFALNPLIIIESLVSAHNDIVMIFLSLVGLYFLFRRSYILSILFLIASIGIKFATIFLMPIFIIFAISQWMKIKLDTNKLLLSLVFLMTVATIAISFSSGPNKNPEPQPWYLLNLIPFVALTTNGRILKTITVCLSFGALLFYLPFIYTGEWPKNIVEIKVWIVIIAILTGIIMRFKFAKYLAPFV